MSTTTTDKSSYLKGATAALLAALRAKDLETRGHTARVARYSVLLGRRLGLEGTNLIALYYGALLHDVGKITTKDAVLKKPGSHTEIERSHMREHATAGAEMVRDLGFPEAVIRIVAQHHERFDGRGYPEGYTGNEIDFGARVFSVADTLDAMTHDRCYRASPGYTRARSEISAEAGKQFCPTVVEAFCAFDAADWKRAEVTKFVE